MTERHLFDTYEKIHSEKSTERSSGLSGIDFSETNVLIAFANLKLELKKVLLNSKNAYGTQFALGGLISKFVIDPNRKYLNDKGFHKMFEAIFRAAIKEKTLYARQQKESLKKTIGNRLSLCGSVFRLAVELGVRHIKNKTFKAVYRHIVDILPQAGEGLCEPISLDYIKALHVCLEYAPHAEHLPGEDWEMIAMFCCTHVESQLGLLNDNGGDVDGDSDEDMDSREVLLIRSSRPNLIRDTSSSSRISSPSPQISNVRLNHNSEELLLCLQILLRTPNAPVVKNGEMTCKTVLGFLTSQQTVTRAHQPALSALNSILEAITTNNIALSTKVSEDIVPVINKMWGSKATATREQTIITLIYIQPYLRNIIRGPGVQARALRRNLEALSDVVFGEYSARAERDQFQLDDLVFPNPCNVLDVETTPLGLPAYCLRNDAPPRAEQQWIVPYLMAMIIDTLDRADGETISKNKLDRQISSKRRRVSKHFDELLRNAKSTVSSTKICALQTLSFLISDPRRSMDQEEFSSVVMDLLNTCSDDNPVVSSWAMLSIASCAFLRPASDLSNQQSWNQIWQLCIRYSANQSTCRAACHLMRILLALNLVSYSEISASVDAMIMSIDLSGPSSVVDSALAVWCLILERRNTVAHSSLLQPGERLLRWLISKWRPVDTLDRTAASFYVQHVSPENICNFLLSCCGRNPLDLDSCTSKSCGTIGQSMIRVTRYSKLLKFLLLEEDSDSEENPDSVGESQRGVRKESYGNGSILHPGVELQVVEFLERQCEIVHEVWKAVTENSAQQPSSDMVHNYVGFACITSILCSIVQPRDVGRVEALGKRLRILTRSITSYLKHDDCKELHVDGLLKCVSGILPKPADIINSSRAVPGIFKGACGEMLYTVSQALGERAKAAGIIEIAEGNGDGMDLDGDFGMEVRTGNSSDKKDGELAREEIQAMCSPETFRCCTTGLLALFAKSFECSNPYELCGRFAEYLQELPTPRLIMSRPLFRDFMFAASLREEDAERLTRHLGAVLLQGYETERCETAIELCVDHLGALVSAWAVEGARGELSTLCEQIYEWTARVALEKLLLSHTVRMSMAHLLQRMLEVNLEYGKKSDMSSARSQFIKRLGDRDVRVSFFMANCTPILFKIFGLGVHQTVFKDVLACLTNEMEWIEGLAIRVYTLAQLADTPFPMKKSIVYHIFETGQLESMVKYAARSLSFVAKALKLENHRSLFKIFSPQILYTWIENMELAAFPFRVFGYKSQKDLFADIQEDLVAQLLVRDKDDASENLATILEISYDELLERGFHKIVAYGVAWAIGIPPREDGQYLSVETRLRQRMGGKEYSKLLERKFALIIACLFQIMQEDGTSVKFLSKDPSLSDAGDIMKSIISISHSSVKLPDPLRPFFKVRVILNSIHRICNQVLYDDSCLRAFWTPAMFAFVARRLFDTMDPALGSLHACAVVRKIRLLVCLAGNQALKGYALEMVIHGLKPFIVDGFCSEDAVGVMQYLLEKGKEYLSKQPAFVTGTFLSMLASLRAFLSSPPNPGQDDNQFSASHSIALSFHTWLGGCLEKYHFSELSPRQNQMFRSIVESAMGFRSGNAYSRTKESDLLRHLLNDGRSKNPLLDDVSRGLAFSLVCSDFERPRSFRDDIFGEDAESMELSRVLLRTCRRLDVNEGFLLWCARVLGRSYAASGRIYNEWTQEIELEKMIDFNPKRYDFDLVPKAGILHRLRSLLLGDDRLVIGVAENTLQTIFFEEVHAGDIKTYDYIFKEDLYSALTWKVLPTSLAEEENPRPIITVGKPETLPVDIWVKDLTSTISTNLQQDAVVKNLRPILDMVEGLAKDLFPFVVHVLLLHNFQLEDDRLRMELSRLFRDCFRTCTEKTVPHTIILIKTVLYLRTQPMEQETTPSPRDHWLDINYLEMARAACTCKMFKTSLLFAEIHHSETETETEFLAPDLLLEVFKNVDDLDSYYGVTQSPSLKTVLRQFEYENDGWKSLSFRGANLESHLRLGSSSDGQDVVGIVDAFNTMGMNGLSHFFIQGGVAQAAGIPDATLDNMFRSAWKLEQWDLPCPLSRTTRSAIIYRTLQLVNNDVDTLAMPSHLDSSFLDLMCQITTGKQTGHSLGASMRTLAMLTEMEEILVSKEIDEVEKVWDRLQMRTSWMHTGRYSDVEEIMAMRQATFSSLTKRAHLRQATKVNMKTARFLEAKALVGSCKMARSHKVLQHSLSAATQLSKAVESCKQVGLDISAVATLQAANVLWDQGQGISPIRMLQALQTNSAVNQQSITVGKAKLLAKLGNWISEARLEKPDKIMSTYLVPAIDELGGGFSGSEAGRVFHEFASFCDQQLQNPGNIEDYQRALKLRQNKEAEVRELETLMKSVPHGQKLEIFKRDTREARSWLNLDDAEFNKLKENREAFLERSIEHYLRCLAACDDYDNDAVRFCALWLEHSDDLKVNMAASQPLAQVPSRKFVPLMNQLSSRLLDVQDGFQKLLFPLIARICIDHPHHGTYQILALSKAHPTDPVSVKRQASALKIVDQLKKDERSRVMFQKLLIATSYYIKLAAFKMDKPKLPKYPLSALGGLYGKFHKDIPSQKIPPPTMQIDVRNDCDYQGLPVLERFDPEFAIASGISAPKVLSCRASDGRNFRMLFKGGNDDLRQDAIMEQVFEQVSNLLQKNRTTRQRNLSIRTYKVLPLTATTGIIEFVRDTVPLHDYLIPAHERYRPRDMKPNNCRKMITEVQTKSRDIRVKTFQKVMQLFAPVMRYFFMHKFNGPDDWFDSRLAYSRSTAATSILGHVLGLGDRHGHNILLDEKSGEVVHIDLGVAFEQGRVLPVPEVVPFRLTRDIVDGMGITKTEGVFRRCCEFTLTVLRNESYNIITILDVLRYDPLYRWTISPLRVKRMQEESQSEGVSHVGGLARPKKEESESQADRALTVVAKKLSKTLSVGATVNELIQQATDEKNLAVLYSGWGAYA